ncbi:MAG TPA: DNA repair exonuclease [Bacillus bacterium]|nr:DNA repair exonuclease [Bacillus sp. (in: firmicutes)]
MDAIKFIHTADLHLDSPFKGLNHLPTPIFKKLKESTFVSFNRIIELAISEHIDFVLVAGDLFDNHIRSLKAQISLRKGFERLEEAGICVYVIHGNHDHLGGSWAELTWPENVYFFSENVEVTPFQKKGKTLAYIHGFSYEKRAVTENMVKYYHKKEDDLFHIGMLHGNLEGKDEHDPYAPFTINQLLEKNFDYWALGHIHKRQILHENPTIIYPGNIQGRHRKEFGDKGCFVVELTKLETKQRFVPCAPIVWETENITIDSLVTVDELIIAIKTCKERYRNLRQGAIVTINLLGSGLLHEELNDSQFINDLCDIVNEGEELAENFVWVASCQNNTAIPYNRNLLKSEAHFISDLLQQVDDYNDDFFEEALGMLLKNHKVNPFLQNVKEDRREILVKAERLLLHELLKG